MPNVHDAELAAHEAHGMASEAIQAVRSNEKISDLRFRQYDVTVMEIKDLLKKMDEKVDRGFRSYDNKFWSLAITLIGILLTISGFLIIYTLFPGQHPHG